MLGNLPQSHNKSSTLVFIVEPLKQMVTMSMWANALLLLSSWTLEVSALIEQAALVESLQSSKLPLKRIVNGDAVSKGKYPFLALTYGTKEFLASEKHCGL